MPSRPVKKTVTLRRQREAARQFFGAQFCSDAAPVSDTRREETAVCFPSCAAEPAEDRRAPARNATAPHSTLTAASNQAERRNPSAGTMTNVLASIPTTAPSVLEA